NSAVKNNRKIKLESDGVQRKSLNGLEALLSAAAMLILIATILLSAMDWREFRRATDLSRHTGQVLDATETLLSALKDAETGQRGYLLTGEKKYLEPYDS